MKVINCLQGTPEWNAARLGKVTASRVSDVIARTRSGWGASRDNYMAQLIAERLTGAVQVTFTNSAMQWGTETEPQARTAYEFYQDIEVAEVGFVCHPAIQMAGASPDGIAGADGLIEIKCPNTATHIDTLLGGTVPEKYVVQMLWQMACAERAWCDFVSYDPRMPEEMRLFVCRVLRDDKRIGELERHVEEFLSEMEDKLHKLRAAVGMREAA
jgi:putative phage-type endonuclease